MKYDTDILIDQHEVNISECGSHCYASITTSHITISCTDTKIPLRMDWKEL